MVGHFDVTYKNVTKSIYAHLSLKLMHTDKDVQVSSSYLLHFYGTHFSEKYKITSYSH